ncbi:tyrosinase-like isoform X2 [Ptychodera flava]|uniref:tyrosinase-like isoform X2 n=1 Tax=Ptychodera flava TaxID=63121 RepID=UPI00396A8287
MAAYLVMAIRGCLSAALPLTVFIAFLCSQCTGQFPKDCLSPHALSSKECCPVPEGHRAKCGGAGRGTCEDLSVESADWSDYVGDRDRFQWPYVFFHRACKCEGNYDGPDCGTCKFGFYGGLCADRVMLVRKNILKMPRAEVEKVKAYILEAKNTVSKVQVATSLYVDMEDGRNPFFNDINEYDLFTWLHYYATRPNIQRPAGCQGDGATRVDFAHAGPAFFSWNRLHLLLFERMLQRVNNDYTFALPYWDFSEATHCDVCNDIYMGDSSATSPHRVLGQFGKFKTLCADAERFHGLGLVCSNIDTSQSTFITRHPGHAVNPSTEPAGLPAGLPSKDSALYSLSMTAFDRPPQASEPRFSQWLTSPCSFRNVLEGFADSEKQTGRFPPIRSNLHNQLHNLVHSYMNGTLSHVMSSPSDPLFYLIHTNVDRIAEKWIRRHRVSMDDYPQSNTPIGQSKHSSMVPFFPIKTNGEFLSQSQSFGYTYDDIDNSGRPLDELEKEKEDSAIEEMKKCMVHVHVDDQSEFSKNPDVKEQQIIALLTRDQFKLSELQNIDEYDINECGQDVAELATNKYPSDMNDLPRVRESNGIGSSLVVAIIAMSVIGIILFLVGNLLIKRGLHGYYRRRAYQQISGQDFVSSRT